jgi:glycosyltransferase involved in cell wall biosynthesis
VSRFAAIARWGTRAKWAIDAFQPARLAAEPPLRLLHIAAGELGRGRPRRALRAARLALGKGAGSPPEAASAAEAARVLIESVLLESPRIESAGVGASEVAAALQGDPRGAVARVLVEAVGRHRGRSAARALARAADGAALVVLLEPAWPEGCHFVLGGGASTRPRRVETWRRLAERAGLEVAAEMRPAEGRLLGLALRRRGPDAEPAPETQPSPRVTSEPARIRIHDDLSHSTAFAWTTGKLALALHARGADLTIAPTALAPSFSSAERRSLRQLMSVTAPPDLDGELGYTHYWREYQRPLGGRRPLALCAINYTFSRADRRPLDPWLAGLVNDGVGLAPVSSFCRDTLLLAGVSEERLGIVPMGLTSAPAEPCARTLPGSRGLSVLHVTNSSDPIRHGTETGIDAFELAFAPTDPATLVIRDYGPGSAVLAARIRSLRRRGYDVRYWPIFFSEAQLAETMQSFQVLLAPFRGEGFGIKLLDAMAAGLVPIAPLFGGATDFMSRETALVVPNALAPMTSGYDAERVDFDRQPLWAEVDADDVAVALRKASAEPDDVSTRSAAARRRALEFTWDRAAEAVVARMGPGR